MQVTEVSSEGLKREYKVIVPADDIETRIGSKLEEIRKSVKMPGFRPGKVPLKLLRKQYGPRVMGEVLEQAVNEGSQNAIAQHELRPALRPKIEVTSFDEGADLEFSMALEVLPEVPPVDLKAITLERPVTPVDDEVVGRALQNLAERSRRYEAPAEPRPAESGDQILIDFEGRVDGEPFDGGKAEDFPLVLGSGRFIPGFEEQLIGAATAEERTVEVTFPDAYANADLAGKPAAFAVTVKEIRAPLTTGIDDELAKGQGFDDLDAMRAALRERIETEYGSMSRARAKRALLDRLAETCTFVVPEGMVDLEFETIWKQVSEELKQRPEAAEGKSEDELKAEYRGIAERRVRLGLVLSDVGQKNELKVEPHELNAAVLEQARRYPGQEQQVVTYFRENPGAVEQLRAPIYEDKVVDFILQIADVADREVTLEELMRDPDDEPDAAATTSDDDAATPDDAAGKGRAG